MAASASKEMKIMKENSESVMSANGGEWRDGIIAAAAAAESAK
jgi:hypothetical protein